MILTSLPWRCLNSPSWLRWSPSPQRRTGGPRQTLSATDSDLLRISQHLPFIINTYFLSFALTTITSIIRTSFLPQFVNIGFYLNSLVETAPGKQVHLSVSISSNVSRFVSVTQGKLILMI